MKISFLVGCIFIFLFQAYAGIQNYDGWELGFGFDCVDKNEKIKTLIKAFQDAKTQKDKQKFYKKIDDYISGNKHDTNLIDYFSSFCNTLKHQASHLELIEIFLKHGFSFNKEKFLSEVIFSLVVWDITSLLSIKSYRISYYDWQTDDESTFSQRVGEAEEKCDHDIALIRFLLKIQADPNGKDKTGSTTLHQLLKKMIWLRKNNNLDSEWKKKIVEEYACKVIKLLVEYGANPDIKNNDNKNCWDLCIDCHELEVSLKKYIALKQEEINFKKNMLKNIRLGPLVRFKK